MPTGSWISTGGRLGLKDRQLDFDGRSTWPKGVDYGGGRRHAMISFATDTSQGWTGRSEAWFTATGYHSQRVTTKQ